MENNLTACTSQNSFLDRLNTMSTGLKNDKWVTDDCQIRSKNGRFVRFLKTTLKICTFGLVDLFSHIKVTSVSSQIFKFYQINYNANNCNESTRSAALEIIKNLRDNVSNKYEWRLKELENAILGVHRNSDVATPKPLVLPPFTSTTTVVVSTSTVAHTPPQPINPETPKSNSARPLPTPPVTPPPPPPSPAVVPQTSTPSNGHTSAPSSLLAEILRGTTLKPKPTNSSPNANGTKSDQMSVSNEQSKAHPTVQGASPSNKTGKSGVGYGVTQEALTRNRLRSSGTPTSPKPKLEQQVPQRAVELKPVPRKK